MKLLLAILVYLFHCQLIALSPDLRCGPTFVGARQNDRPPIWENHFAIPDGVTRQMVLSAVHWADMCISFPLQEICHIYETTDREPAQATGAPAADRFVIVSIDLAPSRKIAGLISRKCCRSGGKLAVTKSSIILGLRLLHSHRPPSPQEAVGPCVGLACLLTMGPGRS